jgi:uncharacterized membrane protein
MTPTEHGRGILLFGAERKALTKGRLEAFSDGVLAIVITIMVLEFKIPHGKELKDLLPLIPIVLAYVLSFINLGIYWNNHHHLLQRVQKVDGVTLWANLHLLFWLSLVPFTTAWMGETQFAVIPAALYGTVLFMSGCSYYLFTRALIRLHGEQSEFAHRLGRDRKGKFSLLLYVISIPSAFLSVWITLGLIAVVALIWLVPDPRFEAETPHQHG